MLWKLHVTVRLCLALLCSPAFPRELAEGLVVTRVQEVYTTDNPWREPPADVLEKGMAYTVEFLKDLDGYGRTSSNLLKVVLVGLANAGKTSVALRLENGRASDPLPTVDERTIGVEIRDIKLGPRSASGESEGSAELDVKLWDFAGQRAYYDTHQVRHADYRTMSAAIC